MTEAAWRPDSLIEVSRRVLSGESGFNPAVREFLDDFYLYPARRTAALAERPLAVGDIEDAYLSAVAEHLARSYALPVPEWTEVHGWTLTRPYFAGGLESLKALLIVESPAAFRRRLLFVSANALDRPRRARESAMPAPESGESRA